MEEARVNLIKSRAIDTPTFYVSALLGEFSNIAFDEERAPQLKSKWRQEFGVSEETPVDLEIGTGNGYYFAHRAKIYPHRCLVGIEIKYKPLIQAVRRAQREGCNNMRGVRYDGRFPQHLFTENEINDVVIHHPDPWEKRRRFKRRLLDLNFLNQLYPLQKAGSHLEFKTDSSCYFLAAMEEFKKSNYKLEIYTEDLHASEYAKENFVTHFETLFTQRGRKINFARFVK